MAILRAATRYAAIVFAIGFLLGTVRVLLIAPRLGALGATLIELPVMLAASWIVCGRVLRRLPLSAPGARLAMGAIAFVLLIGAEVALGVFGFGRTLPDQIAAMATPAGLAGLAAQIGFGLFPLLRGSPAPARP